MTRSGSRRPLLGVDVLRGRELVASDADEAAPARADRHGGGRTARVVVTPVGGQGFLFGRGNQQLSSPRARAGRPGERRRRRDGGEARCARRPPAARRYRRRGAGRKRSPATPRRRRLRSRGRLPRSSRSRADRQQAKDASDAPSRAHPYIPNSAPADQGRRCCEAIGAADVDELYGAIPERLRLRRPLDLPPALRSELELRRHARGRCSARNDSCRGGPQLPRRRLLAALRPGGRATRSSTGREFVTAYYGETLHRPRQAPGALRVREPDRRARRARRRRASRRTTGRRAAATRDLHGGAHHRPAAARSCRPRSSPERLAVIARLLRAVDRRSSAMPVRRGDRPARPRRAAGGARRRRRLRLRREPRLPRRRSRREARADRRAWPTTPARSSSSASTRSRSACSRRRRATAPTSSAASCSRSASTCTSAAASRASSPRPTRSATSPSTRPS